MHGREFYTYTDSMRTDLALRAVYAQLVARSLTHEGVYPPLDLNAPISSTATFSEALSTFVHQWDFTQATARRAFADNLAQLVLIQRQRVFLPLVLSEPIQSGDAHASLGSVSGTSPTTSR